MPKVTDIHHNPLKEQILDRYEGRPSSFVNNLSLRQKIALTWRGKTRAGDIIGGALDVAEVVLPQGRAIGKLRTRLRGNKPMDKPRIKSKTIWGIAIAALGAVGQALGIDLFGDPVMMDSIYHIIYGVGGALGLYGLRDAAGRQIQETRELNKKLGN